MTTTKRPDYRVLARNCYGSNPNDCHLVRIGSAWNNTTKDGSCEYIGIKLYARPWNNWDGRLQLYKIDYSTSSLQEEELNNEGY